MSEADKSSFSGFGKLVPGFDFLQNLAKQAAASATPNIPQMPSLGNWVAPTINVEELDKRIEELKAVQFWLDQNAMALKATIQALEVQKMTLATLKGMNFNMGDLANAFRLKVADTLAGSVQKTAEKAPGFAGLEIPPTGLQAAQEDVKARAKARTAKAAESAPGVVDPMQWWGALTQQFQNIATTAMQDAAKNSAVSAASDAMKNATGMADAAGKTVASGARSVMDQALRSAQDWPTPAAPAKSARAKPNPSTPARKTARKTVGKSAR
jgi:hypothetical protein